MSLLPAFKLGIWNAWIFMSIFILQMLAVIFLGKKVWRRSSRTSGIERSRLEAKASVIGNTIWFLATAYSIFLPLRLGTIWFSIGLPVFLVGLIILAVATVNFATAPMQKPIVQGTYRFSRHPLYLSLFIVYVGTSISTASWVFFILGIADVFWIRIESLVEERYCLERYGSDYREYMNRTPRWIGIYTVSGLKKGSSGRSSG
jgi:protein-S-isoprenylcysteine O-methyltransferase Ste14